MLRAVHVQYIRCTHEDTKQDATSVLASKQLVMTELIPQDFPRAKSSYFNVDGAGCFAGNVMHGAQLEWKRWTGIEELENSVTITGDGKTKLDGEFGHIGPTMQTSLNAGMSYNSAETMCAAACARGGHKATLFGWFNTIQPDEPLEVRDGVDLTGFPLVRLERSATGEVIGLRGWWHSKDSY